jgi:hypothetical protein
VFGQVSVQGDSVEVAAIFGAGARIPEGSTEFVNLRLAIRVALCDVNGDGTQLIIAQTGNAPTARNSE